jgi:phage protein U
MFFSLDEFQFTSKVNINSLSRSLDSGVTFQDRIANHAAAVAGKKWSETLSIEGETIPASGAGQKSLDKLLDMAKAQAAYSLTTGGGVSYGRFVIMSVKEGREAFTDNGAFLKQSFSMELRRVEDSEGGN